MRVLPLIITAVLLFAPPILAQSKYIEQAFEAGIKAANEGKYENALENFRNALEKSKFSANLSSQLLAKINYNIGVCYYRLDGPGHAIDFFTVAMRLAKNKYPRAARALGMAHLALDDWRGAEIAFRTAIKLNDKRDGESWFDLGTIYLRQKDLPRAAACFEKAIFYKSVDDAVAHNNLGVIAAFGGNWEKAEAEFQMALNLSGGNLSEAKRNLEICRAKNSGEISAQLESISNYKNNFPEEKKNER